MTFPIPVSSKLALCSALIAFPGALMAENAQDPSGQEAAVKPAASAPGGFDAGFDVGTFTLAASLEASAEARASAQGPAAPQDEGERPPSRGFQLAMPKVVFDENWLSVGIGAGLVPSYAGSDDYILFPLPLIVGRVGGVGIRPNGPGLRLDLLSPAPSIGPNQKPVFNFGPAIRFRNDRAQQVQDDVVEQAEDLDIALEVGAAGGVTIPGVFNPLDSLTFNTQVRWDVLGAHDGMLVEPTLGYLRPFGPGIQLQSSIGLQFVDDSFADYYYTVTPDQSAATGLPLFTADGGLNSVSSTAVVNFDLDGNALNGGLSIYTVVGYTRLLGDAADTPFTDIRGYANQFIGGVGVAYTF